MEDRRLNAPAPWWYLRRAVPWTAVLGCCAAAVTLAAAVARWPATAGGLLPPVLGCCAAAGAFVFDEDATLVTSVTPRARWRLAVRCGGALVPLALGSTIVLLRPGGLPAQPGGWLLIAGALLLATVGAAGVGTWLGHAAPGSLVAALVALVVFAPIVVGPLLGWPSPYPVDTLTTGIRTGWLIVGGAGAAACLVTWRRA